MNILPSLMASNIAKKKYNVPMSQGVVAPVTIYRTRKLVEKEWKNIKLLENSFLAITSSYVSQSS